MNVTLRQLAISMRWYAIATSDARRRHVDLAAGLSMQIKELEEALGGC